MGHDTGYQFGAISFGVIPGGSNNLTGPQVPRAREVL